MFNDDLFTHVDARRPSNVLSAAGDAIQRLRCGKGPAVLHCELDRLCSHTSSDDHRVYRCEEDIAAMNARDPIALYAQQLIDAGELTTQQWEQMQRDIEEQVAREYSEAEQAEDPIAEELWMSAFQCNTSDRRPTGFAVCLSYPTSLVNNPG